VWEDEDGTVYSEPALQKMFGMKFAAQPGAAGGADQPEDTEENEPLSNQESAQNRALANPGRTGEPAENQTSPLADSLKGTAEYMQWRDQNFRNRDDGSWEGPDARTYTDKDLQTIYGIRQKQWPQPQAQSAQSNGMTVSLTYPDGTIERRTGNHPQRDNNPGNIEAGDFTDRHGAIGKDKGFAVFPAPEVGWAALDANLRSNKYQNLSIDAAIADYAPARGKNGEFLNDTPKYQANVRAALGLPGDTKLSALTPQQFETLKQAIAQFEGFYDKSPNGKVKVIVAPPQRPNVIPRN
jgi:hypothetical protein